MRCRGQVTPASRELVYEVFVEELIAGPEPTLYRRHPVHGRRAQGLPLPPHGPAPRPRLAAGLEARTARTASSTRGPPRPRATCASTGARCWPAPGDGPRRPSAPPTAPSTARAGWRASPARPTTSCRASRASRARWGRCARAARSRSSTTSPPTPGTSPRTARARCPSPSCSRPRSSPAAGWRPGPAAR